MELEEDKISIGSIKQYLRLFVNNLDEFSRLEFRTIKGWLVYSLCMLIAIGVPIMGILLVVGFLSGDMSWDLIWWVSLIPFFFMLPMILVTTYINNYWLPKNLRKTILRGLEQYKWDKEVKQIGQVSFESMMNGYTYITEARLCNVNKRRKWFIFMMVFYYVPKNVEDKGKYMDEVNSYLKGRAIFVMNTNVAYFMAPVKKYLKLDLTKSLEELHYVMNRFELRTCTYYSSVNIYDKIKNTLEILAMTMFGVEIDQRWMNWAKAMIEAGFVNDNMREFSGEVPLQDNQDELKEKMDRLICEFNLEIEKEYALTNYIRYLLCENESGQRTILNVIESLSNLYRSSGLSSLQDFDLLYIAKCELDRTGMQSAWTKDALTRENVDACIVSHLSTLAERGMSDLS